MIMAGIARVISGLIHNRGNLVIVHRIDPLASYVSSWRAQLRLKKTVS